MLIVVLLLCSHIIVLCRWVINYPGLPSGVPGLVLGMGVGAGLGIGLDIGVWGHPRTVVGNPG